MIQYNLTATKTVSKGARLSENKLSLRMNQEENVFHVEIERFVQLVREHLYESVEMFFGIADLKQKDYSWLHKVININTKSGFLIKLSMDLKDLYLDIYFQTEDSQNRIRQLNINDYDGLIRNDNQSPFICRIETEQDLSSGIARLDKLIRSQHDLILEWIQSQ